jgi:hypothetical protein
MRAPMIAPSEAVPPGPKNPSPLQMGLGSLACATPWQTMSMRNRPKPVPVNPPITPPRVKPVRLPHGPPSSLVCLPAIEESGPPIKVLAYVGTSELDIRHEFCYIWALRLSGCLQRWSRHPGSSSWLVTAGSLVCFLSPSRVVQGHDQSFSSSQQK